MEVGVERKVISKWHREMEETSGDWQLLQAGKKTIIQLPAPQVIWAFIQHTL